MYRDVCMYGYGVHCCTVSDVLALAVRLNRLRMTLNPTLMICKAMIRSRYAKFPRKVLLWTCKMTLSCPTLLKRWKERRNEVRFVDLMRYRSCGCSCCIVWLSCRKDNLNSYSACCDRCVFANVLSLVLSVCRLFSSCFPKGYIQPRRSTRTWFPRTRWYDRRFVSFRDSNLSCNERDIFALMRLL